MACIFVFIATDRFYASIHAASSSTACHLESTCLFVLSLIAFALACHSKLTIIYLIIVSKTYSIIIINVYPFLLSAHTILLVEVGSLADSDAAVEASVEAGEFPVEETEEAALTLDYLVVSFIPLSAILAASDAASTCFSRLSAAASTRHYRLVH